MVKRRGKGKLEVICGSMFSGKSEELIRRIRRAEFAQQKTCVFKHRITYHFRHFHYIMPLIPEIYNKIKKKY